MRGYFGHFHDIGEDDQVQVAVVGVLAALGGYDRRRGPVEGAGGDRLSKPFSTYATTVIKRRLIDLHRGRSRRAAQDVAIAVCADAVARGEAGEVPELGDEELAVWLRTIRVTAQRRAGRATDAPRRRGRPRRFTPAQEVACAALMWRRGLSPRGAAAELGERPELAAAIGLPGVPSLRWLAGVADFCTRFPQKAATANNRRATGTTGHVGRLLPFVELQRRSGMQNLVQGELRDVPALLRLADIQARVINLSRSTLDQLIAAKRFPAPVRRVGRHRLWARSDVEVWLRTPEPQAAPAAKPAARANN
jgi:predicted DNA-binding transcriptional regulator AlpA